MSTSIPWTIAQTAPSAIDLSHGGQLLLRYVFVPDSPLRESPKPYCHPIFTLGGRTLTNLRPNDHPWHHALAMTLTHVDGVNFWGGPTWTAATSYAWAHNHGTQRHAGWIRRTADGTGITLEHTLLWEPDGASPLLEEQRTLSLPSAGAGEGWWTLRWTSRLKNISGRALRLSHYHAEGLAGSHYTGLLFRGARDLLANTADAKVGIVGPGGLTGDQLHGATADWMAFRCSHDGFADARSTIVFVDRSAQPGAWFVRQSLPAAGFTFHYPDALTMAEGATLILDHAIVFADDLPEPADLAAMARVL